MNLNVLDQSIAAIAILCDSYIVSFTFVRLAGQYIKRFGWIPHLEAGGVHFEFAEVVERRSQNLRYRR